MQIYLFIFKTQRLLRYKNINVNNSKLLLPSDRHLTFSLQLEGVLPVKYKQHNRVCGIDYLRQSLERRSKSSFER